MQAQEGELIVMLVRLLLLHNFLLRFTFPINNFLPSSYTLTASESSHLAVFERFGESQHQDRAF